MADEPVPLEDASLLDSYNPAEVEFQIPAAVLESQQPELIQECDSGSIAPIALESSQAEPVVATEYDPEPSICSIPITIDSPPGSSPQPEQEPIHLSMTTTTFEYTRLEPETSKEAKPVLVPVSTFSRVSPPEELRPAAVNETEHITYSVPISIPYSESIPIEPSNRNINITSIDVAPLLSHAGVRGMVTQVSHGTFHSRPASLIIFSFSLRSGEHGFRFKNAHVKITFAKHASSPSSEAGPAIVQFAPRKIYGVPTKEGKKQNIGGEISLQVPLGPLTIGPTIHAEKESEFETSHRFQTVGNYWSTKHGDDWDIVYWDLRENRITKKGIPDRLNVGAVVERRGPFTATVEVTVDTPVIKGVFAFPWGRERQVVFKDSVEMGRKLRTRKFEDLREDEWKDLIPFEEEWVSKFTEEPAGGLASSTQK